MILYKNNVYTLSDELAADIIASHVRAKKTNLPIKTEQREFKEKSRGELLLQIPRGALVSGVIHLPEEMEITFPPFPGLPRASVSESRGAFKTMEQKGNDLILSFASKEQIEKLALTEYFDLQTEKVKSQIKEAEISKGLTSLGRELLYSREEAQRQKVHLAELTSQLGEINVKIEELKVKMKARRFVFSGEVYLRQ